MPATTSTLSTIETDISIVDSGGDGPPVLLLHGNSSCKEVFRNQMAGALGRDFRLIAMDLPGHGASSDARDPASTYTLEGYGRAALEVLAALGVNRAAVFGWSLGGHVALDLISRFPGMTSVMICGTPPISSGPADLARAFKPSRHMALAGSKDWAEGDAEAYARETAGAHAPFEPFLLDAARRTHGLARETFFADALSGRPDDQRRIVETARIPLAIVNGGEDAFIVAEFFEGIAYANLWDGKVHSLPGLGHAPFWEAPERFDPLMRRFVEETGGLGL
jgi:pimeloyl-ACP methyl ester carboxylesterase